MTFNIRNKLILFALIAIVLPLGISALIILLQLTSFTSERSQERIQSDARVAYSIFSKRQENLRTGAQSIAQTLVGRGLIGSAPAAPATPAAQPAQPAGAQPATAAPSRALTEVLDTARKATMVSFVAVLDAKGKVVAQHNGAPQGDGMYFKDNPLFTDVNNAPQEGPQSGPAIEDSSVIQALGLAEAARVQGVEKGMFLEAAAPILQGDQLRGIVLIGQLINGEEGAGASQSSIVNEIKETLYPTMRDEAAAIIALEDTIVAANMPGAGGGSATGSKVAGPRGSIQSPSFTQQDFGGGSYYTSFVPVSQSGKATGSKEIGRIGVAIKESWFTAIISRVRWTIVIVTLVALLLAIGGAVYASQRLTRPIVELTEAANRISLGELDVPIAVQSGDEIGTLGESLDRMRISLKQAIERLRKR